MLVKFQQQKNNNKYKLVNYLKLVNYRQHCSASQKLQKINSRIIIANCNAHISHNSAKYAMKLMDYNVEILVLQVFSEFSNSSNNVTPLKDCFEFVQQEYLELLRHIPVHWLTLFCAVQRLLKNWPAIKSYFLIQGIFLKTNLTGGGSSLKIKYQKE